MCAFVELKIFGLILVFQESDDEKFEDAQDTFFNRSQKNVSCNSCYIMWWLLYKRAGNLWPIKHSMGPCDFLDVMFLQETLNEL